MAHQHNHLVGASGSGKSTWTKQNIINDIHNGFAVCYVDPHGTDTDELLQYIPRKRRADVAIFDPSQFAIPWNPLETENIPLAANTLLTSIKAAWHYDGMPTPRLDGMLYNSLVALMEAKQSLFGLYLILTNHAYRQHILLSISDPVVRNFWLWFDDLPEKQQLEQSDSTLNKVQILMADPRIRAICGSKSAINIQEYVNRKILFLRLPQGEIGVDKSALLGSMLLSQIHQACMARDTTVPFHLYIDEVQTFAPHTIAEMLSGVRKFNVSITIVHQYMRQLAPALLDSARANTLERVFRVSVDDAKLLPKLGEQEIQPYELPSYNCWVFDADKPYIEMTKPLSRKPYKASAHRVIANQRKYLERSAEKEVRKLLQRFDR